MGRYKNSHLFIIRSNLSIHRGNKYSEYRYVESNFAVRQNDRSSPAVFGGPKNTLHFAEYLKTTKDILYLYNFLHTSRLDYTLFTSGLVTLFHTVAPSVES